MARFEIITAAAASQAIAATVADPAFAARDAHPLTGGFARSYYPKVFQESCRDLSFAIAHGTRLIAIVPMSLIDGALR